ncbi:MAG: argininosuccinate synthase, partial [Minicystis sp.]
MIVEESLRLARDRGILTFAHGCTGMGDDPGTLDLRRARARRCRDRRPHPRDPAPTPTCAPTSRSTWRTAASRCGPKTSKYSINTNILGVTTSGSEINHFAAPGPETYTISAPPSAWPTQPYRARLRFEKGVLTQLDGQALPGPQMLRKLNERFGAYGVGRGIYTGDTTIGLKGRIVFECPGMAALLVTHARRWRRPCSARTRT